MKRGREDSEIEAMAMANCLMLLSKVGEPESSSSSSSGRLFACKTCNRQFPSFQALGGHRASHKKPRLNGGDLLQEPISPKKAKTTHECPICGLEFAIGQALGGHMRRHRAELGGGESGLVTRSLLPVVPVMKKSNSIKRVWGLDLNLAAPVESDLKLELGKAVPILGFL